MRKTLFFIVVALFAFATTGYAATPYVAPLGSDPAITKQNPSREEIAQVSTVAILGYAQQKYGYAPTEADAQNVLAQVQARLTQNHPRIIPVGGRFEGMGSGSGWSIAPDGYVNRAEEMSGIALWGVQVGTTITFNGMVVTSPGRTTGVICYNPVAESTTFSAVTAQPYTAPAPQVQEKVVYVEKDNGPSVLEQAAGVFLASFAQGVAENLAYKIFGSDNYRYDNCYYDNRYYGDHRHGHRAFHFSRDRSKKRYHHGNRAWDREVHKHKRKEYTEKTRVYHEKEVYRQKTVKKQKSFSGFNTRPSRVVEVQGKTWNRTHQKVGKVTTVKRAPDGRLVRRTQKMGTRVREGGRSVRARGSFGGPGNAFGR